MNWEPARRSAENAQLPLDTLIQRARTLIDRGGRRLLGIAGPPGVGKSTLAAALCDVIGPAAARAPLDGFHLANSVLAELGLADRKGAPATFDASGFLSLLKRLHDNGEEVVYAPVFRRDLDAAIAGALPVPQAVPLVVVEGNYLLLDTGPWFGIRALFDETWYLELDDRIRRERLVRRHQDYGRSPDEAAAWTLGNDERNAVVVKATRDRADLVVSAAALAYPRRKSAAN